MPSAIVIGAGPAGCLAAIMLARAGWAVRLIEQHRFPRDKVCGECLSSTGIAVLRRHGLADAVQSLGVISLTRTLVHSANGQAVELPLPAEMWGVSRQAMDMALLHCAAAAGATIDQPWRCEEVREGATPTVRARDLSNNIEQEFHADWVLLADGKGSLLGQPSKATGDLGIKTHFINVEGPRDAIELFGVSGHYGGLAAVEGNRWNAAFNVPAGRVREFHGDLSALFQQIATENLTLSRRLRAARRISPWLASPLPRFAVAATWPERIIPLGNAAAAMEPVGGEGMGLAMRSAELAAEALIQFATDGDESTISSLPTTFRRLWQVPQIACRSLAKLVSMPDASEAAASLIDANPPLANLMMRWVGKQSK